MKSWKVFKDSVPLYLCQSKDSLYFQNKDIIIAKSGVNHFSCNYAIIENQNLKDQKSIIENNFSGDGLIFSLEENKNTINSWSEDLGFKYIGRAALVNKRQQPSQIEKKYYDNIRIEKVLNVNLLKDYINVFAETREITIDEASKMFTEEFLNPIYFMYVAYYLDDPAGIFMAIRTGEGGITADTDVKKRYRQSNVLKLLAEEAENDAMNHQAYDYSAVVSSDFAYNVVRRHGYVFEGYCEFWRRGGGGLNG
jgi:hypothetical protein